MKSSVSKVRQPSISELGEKAALSRLGNEKERRFRGGGEKASGRKSLIVIRGGVATPSRSKSASLHKKQWKEGRIHKTNDGGEAGGENKESSTVHGGGVGVSQQHQKEGGGRKGQKAKLEGAQGRDRTLPSLSQITPSGEVVY